MAREGRRRRWWWRKRRRKRSGVEGRNRGCGLGGSGDGKGLRKLSLVKDVRKWSGGGVRKGKERGGRGESKYHQVLAPIL